MCGNGLPKVVKAKIFEIYDEKLREQLNICMVDEKDEEWKACQFLKLLNANLFLNFKTLLLMHVLLKKIELHSCLFIFI